VPARVPWRTGSLLCFAWWVFCLPVVQAQNAIRFAPEKDYGPFVYLDASGQVTGLSVDILKAIQPALRQPVQTLPAATLADILASARKGDVDLISSLRPTPERSEFLSFTQPYVNVPAVLVVRQSSNPPSLADMNGQPVAVGKGYAVEPFVRQAYPRIQWRAVPDDTAALRELQSGALAGVVADVASVGFAVRQQHLKGLQIAGAVGFEYPLSFAYRKEQVDLGAQLEAGLRNLDPARRKALVDQWMDTSELQFEDPRRAWLRWLGWGGVACAAGWLAVRVSRNKAGV